MITEEVTELFTSLESSKAPGPDNLPTVVLKKCANTLAPSITAFINSSFLYLLLTEFEVRTVSYGPSFFPLIYGPSAKRAGHKSTGKNEDP